MVESHVRGVVQARINSYLEQLLTLPLGPERERVRAALLDYLSGRVEAAFLDLLTAYA